MDKETRKINQEYIKDRLLVLCQNMYNSDLLFCEGVNGFNKKEIDESKKQHQDAYNEIIWRLQDYESFENDDLLDDLNYSDYKKNIII